MKIPYGGEGTRMRACRAPNGKGLEVLPRAYQHPKKTIGRRISMVLPLPFRSLPQIIVNITNFKFLLRFLAPHTSAIQRVGLIPSPLLLVWFLPHPTPRCCNAAHPYTENSLHCRAGSEESRQKVAHGGFNLGFTNKGLTAYAQKMIYRKATGPLPSYCCASLWNEPMTEANAAL